MNKGISHMSDKKALWVIAVSLAVIGLVFFASWILETKAQAEFSPSLSEFDDGYGFAESDGNAETEQTLSSYEALVEESYKNALLQGSESGCIDGYEECLADCRAKWGNDKGVCVTNFDSQMAACGNDYKSRADALHRAFESHRGACCKDNGGTYTPGSGWPQYSVGSCSKEDDPGYQQCVNRFTPNNFDNRMNQLKDRRDQCAKDSRDNRDNCLGQALNDYDSCLDDCEARHCPVNGIGEGATES